MFSIPIDPITLAGCVVLLLFALVGCFCNPFARASKVRELVTPFQSDDAEDCPPLSIVIPILGDAPRLDDLLDRLLSQDYPADIRIILVADKDNARVEELVDGRGRDSRIYRTFIPTSSRYMSRKKLAVTIGIKAVQTEWLIVLEPTCRPLSHLWLRALSARLTGDVEVAMCYARFSSEAPRGYRLEQLIRSNYLMAGLFRGRVYRSLGPCMALRKSRFMEADGFSGSLHLLYGEYDFLANKYSVFGSAALVVQPEAWLEIDAPSSKDWRNAHLSFWALRRELKHGRWFRLRHNADHILLRFNLLSSAIALALSLYTEQWILTGTASLALLVTLLAPIVSARKTLRTFDEDLSAWHILPFALTDCLRQFVSYLRYLRADKLDFTSHRL